MRALAMFSGLGLISTGFLFVISMAPGASWLPFVDGPVFITLAMCTFGGMCLSHGPRATLAAISRTFWNSHEMHAEQREESTSVLETAGRFVWATAIATTIMGVIIILGNLDDSTAIGPSLAVALLPLLYGVVLAEFVIRPLTLSITPQGVPLKNEIRLVASSQPKTTEGALTLGVAILFVAILVPLVFTLFWATPRSAVEQNTRPDVNIDAGPFEFDNPNERATETRVDLGEGFMRHMQQR